MALSGASQAAGLYHVKAGDTLSAIAQRSGVSLSRIRAANHLHGQVDSDHLQAGQVLTIPDQFLRAGSYRVQAGDTLSSIAWRHHLSLAALLRANAGLSATKALRAGKVLYLPARRVVWANGGASGRGSGGVPATKSSKTLAGTVRPAHLRVAWRWPVRGWVSSGYGARTLENKEAMHYGIDVVVPPGTAVHATRAGRVIESRADYARGWGWTIILDHGDGWQTRYAHLSRNLARVGDEVVSGQVIGRSGNTGHSTGPHLHFGTYLWSVPKDPLSLLP